MTFAFCRKWLLYNQSSYSGAMPTWVVTAQESGQKLSIFLKSKLGDLYSARGIKNAVEHNACSVNDRVERFVSLAVGKGDRVTFDDVSIKKVSKVDILFEDDYLLACNKPAGVSSEDPSLAPQAGLLLLHRLDKDTTGVLLWAKNRVFAEHMHRLFKKREIKKTYFALVDQIPKEPFGHIENQLGRVCQYQGQSLWSAVERGEEAVTEWRLERELKDAALLECHPHTGRTHQIRVHLSGIGHPILGDRQYGKRFKCSFRPSRCLLHAYKVEFIHQKLKRAITIIAPLPSDFQEAIDIVGLK